MSHFLEDGRAYNDIPHAFSLDEVHEVQCDVCVWHEEVRAAHWLENRGQIIAEVVLARHAHDISTPRAANEALHAA